MFEAVRAHPELEAVTCGLSIATFRYVPPGLTGDPVETARYLDDLNREILVRLQREGEIFVSNAVVGGRFLLRACIVNFRTTEADVLAVPEVVVRAGRAADREMRDAASGLNA